jgi:hypothetical protein
VSSKRSPLCLKSSVTSSTKYPLGDNLKKSQTSEDERTFPRPASSLRRHTADAESHRSRIPRREVFWRKAKESALNFDQTHHCPQRHSHSPTDCSSWHHLAQLREIFHRTNLHREPGEEQFIHGLNTGMRQTVGIAMRRKFGHYRAASAGSRTLGRRYPTLDLVFGLAQWAPSGRPNSWVPLAGGAGPRLGTGDGPGRGTGAGHGLRRGSGQAEAVFTSC